MKTILVKDEKNKISISLNRPQVRNAFHPEMIAELTSVFKTLKKNKIVRSVVLSGEGESFCAGADLEWMKSMAKFNRVQNKKDAEKLFAMFQEMHELPCPLIGVAHGHAMGGALGLLAVCDVVVAAEKTEFCFSEVKLGLSPAVISAFVKNKMELSQMSRWFLTGEVFTSAQAKEMGLVHEIKPQPQIREVVDKWTRSFAANGPQAVRETKLLLRKIANETSSVKLKKQTTDLIAKLRVSPEGQEGIKGFLEKRSPSWRIQ
jgi:methylglutaconyl-CoA hydratase